MMVQHCNILTYIHEVSKESHKNKMRISNVFVFVVSLMKIFIHFNCSISWREYVKV